MDALSNLPPGMDLMTTPMAPNPSGAPPNFVNPPSLATTTLGVGVSLIVASGFMLVVRLFANWKHSKKLYLDDGQSKLTCSERWMLSLVQHVVFLVGSAQ
jgi:hypothetical protein